MPGACEGKVRGDSGTFSSNASSNLPQMCLPQPFPRSPSHRHIGSPPSRSQSHFIRGLFSSPLP